MFTPPPTLDLLRNENNLPNLHFFLVFQKSPKNSRKQASRGNKHHFGGPKQAKACRKQPKQAIRQGISQTGPCYKDRVMKPKHKPVPAGECPKQKSTLSLVEEPLEETDARTDREELPRSEADVKLNPKPDENIKEFTRLHEVVVHGLLFFIDVGLALATIRQQELWKAGGFSTWTAYCMAIGESSRKQPNRLIRSAQAAHYLSQVKSIGLTPDPTPSCEGQVRPLVVLKTNEDRATAWHKAVELAGGHPTAKIVKGVVDEMRNKSGKPSQKTTWKEELIDFIGRLRALLEERPQVEIENLIAELESNLKI